MDLSLNVDKLTLGDAADLEDISGTGLPAWVAMFPEMSPETMTARELLAVCFVAARQEDPKVTVDDIRKLLLSEVAGAD